MHCLVFLPAMCYSDIMNTQKVLKRAQKIVTSKTSALGSEVGFRMMTAKLPPEAKRTARIIRNYVKKR